jgi:hypothetical protein
LCLIDPQLQEKEGRAEPAAGLSLARTLNRVSPTKR